MSFLASVSFLRRQESNPLLRVRHSCEGRNPALSCEYVIPAKAGIQSSFELEEIPAFAGLWMFIISMTKLVFIKKTQQFRLAPPLFRSCEGRNPALSCEYVIPAKAGIQSSFASTSFLSVYVSFL